MATMTLPAHTRPAKPAPKMSVSVARALDTARLNLRTGNPAPMPALSPASIARRTSASSAPPRRRSSPTRPAACSLGIPATAACLRWRADMRLAPFARGAMPLMLIADLEGSREPRHRVRARLRAYRTRFSVNRKG
jgi:hypothetical protein